MSGTVLADAADIARGVMRLLADHDCTSLTEFTLKSGRRADVMALDAKGNFTIVEVKSGVADYRADRKWQDYLEFCDAFYFAVPKGFPLEILPADTGLILADAWAGHILRPAEHGRLAPARRKALTLRFARVAGQRVMPAAGVLPVI